MSQLKGFIDGERITTLCWRYEKLARGNKCIYDKQGSIICGVVYMMIRFKLNCIIVSLDSYLFIFPSNSIHIFLSFHSTPIYNNLTHNFHLYCDYFYLVRTLHYFSLYLFTNFLFPLLDVQRSCMLF